MTLIELLREVNASYTDQFTDDILQDVVAGRHERVLLKGGDTLLASILIDIADTFVTNASDRVQRQLFLDTIESYHRDLARTLHAFGSQQPCD